MSYLKFPCGCRFKIADDDNTDRDIPVSAFDKLPRVDISLNPWEAHSIYRVSTTCPAVWQMLGEGRTKGIFQLEAALGRQWSKKTKPKNLEDLGALNALLRPGCLRAMSGDPPKSMTQRYADRKMGIEPVNYLHKAIEKALETTYGVLVYQEQAMRIAEEVAGFNKQEADVLRKAIGKKKADIMAKVEKEFLEKAEQAAIITLQEATEIFSWIRESQKYSFNKSHAVAYGKDAYWSAYIKAHFPITFFGAWILGANWKNADKYEEIAELLNDAKLHDVEVKTPQLSTLTKHTEVVNDEFVQFGLTEIKGIGPAMVKKILAELAAAESKISKPIMNWTWIEYLIFAAPELGKTVNEALISVGALDNVEKLQRTRRLFEYQQLSKLSDLEIEWLRTHWPVFRWKTLADAFTSLMPVRQMKNKVWIGGGGTANIKAQKKLESLLSLLIHPPTKLVDTIDWVAETEEHYLGTPVTITKIDGREEAVEANTTCKDFLAGRDGYMLMALEVVGVTELTTRAGKTPGAKMARLSVRDSTCTLEAVVFPKTWAENSSVFYEGSTILAIVERTKDNSLSIKKAKEIS